MNSDTNLIIEQCVHQHATTARDYVGFALAYRDAQQYALKRSWLEQSVIKAWASLVDDRNVNGYRLVPVIAGGNETLAPTLVARAMESLVESWDNLSPTEAYKEFEEIHPFIDGNGRVGHLIWASLTQWQEGYWPDTLPPNLWSSK